MISQDVLLRGVLPVSISLALFSWADSFSSEKSLISPLSRVAGDHMSDHLSSRSLAGERAGDGHSIPLHVA